MLWQKLLAASSGRPTFIAQASGSATTSDPAIVAVPSGTSNGDLMVAFYYSSTNSPNAVTLPSGWTTVASKTWGGALDYYAYVLCRIASSEPASYSFNQTSSKSAAIVTFRSAAFDVAGSLPADSVTAASITVAQTESVLMYMGADNGAQGDFTAVPSGMTQILMQSVGPNDLCIAYEYVSAGSTGTKTPTFGGIASGASAGLISLSPG